MKTAILSLDCQQGILGLVPGNSEATMANAARVIEEGRKRGDKIIHVGIGFEPGYPEIPEGHLMFSRVKESGGFIKGSPTASFHPSLLDNGDLIIYKQRVSAFSENQLQMVLRAQGIRHLVFFGIATSGIVLSTLRQAFDLDFTCTVIGDACLDGDLEVHRVLTEKIFPRQAKVVGTDEFIKNK